MKFFLPFSIQHFPFTFSYRDKILLIGSCFSEEIGNKMNELKFSVLQNPNGILYDPLSISEALSSYIKNKQVVEDDLFELNGLWHSWKHHSDFSSINKQEVLEKINRSQLKAHLFLKETRLLIITLGTAYHYQLKKNNISVANCHKAPSSLFQKNLLDVEQIILSFSKVLDDLKIFNSDLKIIFTVSPVKHVKDGVVENNRSKSRLIEVVHALVDEIENAFYFPSYELVVDVLRDYRFYKNDLVHPNDSAVNFVFEKFYNSLLDDEGKKILEKIKDIMNAVNHRTFIKESETHQKFIIAQLENIRKVEGDHPFIDLTIEKEYFHK